MLNELIEINEQIDGFYNQKREIKQSIESLEEKIFQLDKEYFGILCFIKTILHELFHSILAHLSVINKKENYFQLSMMYQKYQHGKF